MVKGIKMTNIEDAKEINLFATKFSYDTWVHSDSKMVDAKSLLGLISLVNEPNLLFVVPDDIDPKRAFKGLKKFAI